MDSLIQLLYGCFGFLLLVVAVCAVILTYWVQSVEFVPFKAHWTKRVAEEQYFMQVGLPLMVLCSTTVFTDEGESATIKMTDSPVCPIEIDVPSVRSRR